MLINTREELLEALSKGETVFLTKKEWLRYYRVHNMHWIVEASQEKDLISFDASLYLEDSSAKLFSYGVLEERKGPMTQKEYDLLTEEFKAWCLSEIDLEKNNNYKSNSSYWIAIESDLYGIQLYDREPTMKEHLTDFWDNDGFLEYVSDKPSKFEFLTFTFNFTEELKMRNEKLEMENKNIYFQFIKSTPFTRAAIIALTEGFYIRVLTEETGEVFYFLDEDDKLKVTFKEKTLDGDFNRFINVIEKAFAKNQSVGIYKKREEQWYDNIPEKGILCWVSDQEVYTQEKTDLALITERNESTGSFYSITKIAWGFARPALKEELEDYFFQEK